MSQVIFILGLIAFGMGIKRLVCKESMSWYERICFIVGCFCFLALVVSIASFT